jgi:transcription initiation factor TFIID subunit 13
MPQQSKVADEDDIEIVPSSQDSKKRQFTRELRLMMYGFGDAPNPMDESVDVIEELVIDYIVELVS